MASSTQTTGASKRELKTRIAPNTFHLEFYYEGGGEVPDILKGLFTDAFSAELAKSNFLTKKQDEEDRKADEKKNFTRKATGKPIKV